MVLLLLFIAHLTGDFVCQSSKLANEKHVDFQKLLLHSTIYALIFALFLGISVKTSQTIVPFLIIIITHFIIDIIRINLENKAKAKSKLPLFFIDQGLHVFIIAIVYYLFNISSKSGAILELLINNMGLRLVNNTIVYVFIYLTILQPTAVLVKKVFTQISNDDMNSNEESQNRHIDNAGYLIGILERIIITTLVLANQIPTIGFVLAAKSLARFKQLENQDFAEKYLVGTLISVAISIILTLLLKSALI